MGPRTLPLLFALAACATSEDGDALEVEPRVSQIIPGEVEFFTDHELDDPGMTLAAYALGNDGGCNGAFIGPNLYMTAAHCGADQSSVTKTVYEYGDLGRPHHDYATCKFVLQHFDPPLVGSDISLMYCDDMLLADGSFIPPGDFYGYLDFDLRDPVDADDEGNYSLFLRPFPNIAHWPVFWSPGTKFWWDAGPPNPWVVKADIWGELGVSGSAVLAADSDQWIVPPTALVGNGERTFYRSLGMVLANESVTSNAQAQANGNADQVHDSRITALGLNPRDYEAPLDADGNGVMDLQQDIEGLRGERPRSLYRFGFESRRNNAQWSLGPSSFVSVGVSSPMGPWGTIDAWNGAADVVATHESLPLPSGGTFYLSIRLYTSWAQEPPDNLRVRVLDDLGNEVASPVLLSAAGGDQTLNAELETYATGARLEISTESGWLGSIYEVTLRDACDDLDLDTHDQRKLWRDETTQGPAMTVPGDDGVKAEWELWLDPQYAATTTMLGAIEGRSYELCLDTQAGPSANLSAVQDLEVEIADKFQVIDSQTFGVSAFLKRRCMQFTAGNSTRVSLRRLSGPATTTVALDNLSLECLDCDLKVACAPGGGGEEGGGEGGGDKG